MRDAGAIGCGRLGRPHIHPAIELARIGVDDFRTEALSDLEREGSLAGPGRSHDQADTYAFGSFRRACAADLRRPDSKRRNLTPAWEFRLARSSPDAHPEEL